ncbi:MAG: hypothetical protein LLG04_14140 [Parachlamydia sp.]|nr:hypothetical protein [Parachlamydia sp.]
MFPPRYDDCILHRQTSIWNLVESYSYWDGISDKKGWLKFRIERLDKTSVYLSPIPHSPAGVRQILATVLKIVSLATLVLPLVLWLAKQHYRKKHHFVIEAAAIPAVAQQMMLRPGVMPAAPQPAVPSAVPGAVLGHNRPVPRSAMETHLARHFASVRVDADWVLQDAMRFFRVRGNQMGDQKVIDLPREAVGEFLRRHAVEGRLNIHTWTTLQHMAKKIAGLKGEGMDIQKSHQAMIDVLDAVLRKTPYNDPRSEQGNVLRAIRARIDRQMSDRPLLQQMFAEVEQGNLTAAERLAGRYADLKIAESRSPGHDKIGAFVEAGWRRVGGGHGINVELLPAGGRWRFIIAQAGSGSWHHRHDINRDRNLQPVDINRERLIPIKIYEYRTETEAKEIVKQIALYRRGPAALGPRDGNEGKGFYTIFKNGKEIDEHNIPFRLSQRMGNCALHSQEEALFYVCQRLGVVEAANAFQDIVEDKIVRNAYPALKDKIAARGPKETIKPLVQGSAKVTLSNTRVRHVLPLNDGGGFVIGSLAEIALPLDTRYSLEQAEIVRRQGKTYVNLHARNNRSVEVVKTNGIHKVLTPLERIEIQSGDLLKFSGSYQLGVS